MTNFQPFLSPVCLSSFHHSDLHGASLAVSYVLWSRARNSTYITYGNPPPVVGVAYKLSFSSYPHIISSYPPLLHSSVVLERQAAFASAPHLSAHVIYIYMLGY
jgi:hypothetical protein